MRFHENGPSVDDWRLKGAPVHMNELSNCVEALKALRCNLHGDTDPSIGTALDAVIARFERCLGEASINETDIGSMAREALEIVSYILSCCTSIAELISRFHA